MVIIVFFLNDEHVAYFLTDLQPSGSGEGNIDDKICEKEQTYERTVNILQKNYVSLVFHK
jgi:hypothetical protein